MNHIDILNQGVSAWNIWREENPQVKPNLTEANLTGAKLIGADLMVFPPWLACFIRNDDSLGYIGSHQQIRCDSPE